MQSGNADLELRVWWVGLWWMEGSSSTYSMLGHTVWEVLLNLNWNGQLERLRCKQWPQPQTKIQAFHYSVQRHSHSWVVLLLFGTILQYDKEGWYRAVGPGPCIMRCLREEPAEEASSWDLLGSSEPISEQRFLFNIWNSRSGPHWGACEWEQSISGSFLFHTSKSRAPSVIFLLSHCAYSSCISAQVRALGILGARRLDSAGTLSWAVSETLGPRSVGSCCSGHTCTTRKGKTLHESVTFYYRPQMRLQMDV